MPVEHGGKSVTTDERAVSAPVGIVLLLGMLVVGMSVVVFIGTAALDDTRQEMSVERAENTLTQLDSRSALVALGQTGDQEVPLEGGPDGHYEVTSETGWMHVEVVNESAGWEKSLVNQSLGAVVYENGDVTMAYQGGGVWRGGENGSTMVSPPEFHYREETLTLPIISVEGDNTLSGAASISQSGSTTILYPNASQDPGFVNPLQDGYINVTVHSEYYRAWGEYFETRTEGNVSYDHATDTATATLVVPFDEAYNKVLASTNEGGITINGNDPMPPNSEMGVNYPLADSKIESRIDDCESGDPDCADYNDGMSIDSPGTYYTHDYFSGTLDVDDPGGNVTLVVDENFSPDSVDIDMASGYTTTVLVRNSFTMGSNSEINRDGVPGRLAVVVHSSGAVNGNGKYKFRGLLYAPGSDCNLNGGGSPSYVNLEGGAICETITVNGNPNKLTYHDSIEGTDLGLNSDAPKIHFLHVTLNRVAIEDS